MPGHGAKVASSGTRRHSNVAAPSFALYAKVAFAEPEGSDGELSIVATGAGSTVKVTESE